MPSKTPKIYVRVPTRCPMCGNTRLFAAQWPVGPVCYPCYTSARANPRPCAGCEEVRVLVGLPDTTHPTDGVPPSLCGPCSGSPRYSYICKRCGGGEEPYKRGTCVRCAVRDQLLEAFGTAPAGSPTAVLVDALTNSRRPRSVMKWLTNPRGGARVVRELLQRGVAIDHAALDTYDEREVWSLRRALVDLGALPERHDTIARLDVILERVVAEQQPPVRHLLQTYGAWCLLRKKRARYEQTGRFTYNQFRATWYHLEQVGDFLTWLSARETKLDQFDQRTLDMWLADPRHQRSAVAGFLRWASRRRLAPRLTVTHEQHADPDIAMTDEERWAELARCLSDTTIPVDVRAAGALLLLYGVPLERILELTTDHLHVPEGEATPAGFAIKLGGPVIAVPPALGRLLGQLPHKTTGAGVPLVQPGRPRTAWLFPGRGAAGHIFDRAMAARMRKYDLHVRRSRNAALISLAGDLPAPVLSDLLGMSIAAAVHWARRAGRDWHGYLSALEQRERQLAARGVVRSRLDDTATTPAHSDGATAMGVIGSADPRQR